MKLHKNSEQGAIAIEALISLTFFLLAILAIMFMSLMVRLQANMQYALDQTAKEISGYYYLVDKMGLAGLTSGVVGEDTQKKNENLNQAIGTVVSFSEKANPAGADIDFEYGVSFEEITNAGDDIHQLAIQGQKLKNEVSAITKDPKGQVQAVLLVCTKSAIQGGLSKFVAPFICQNTMPKYLVSSSSGNSGKSVNERANEMLENAGIPGGLDGNSVSFTHSELLADGRSIKLVVVYQVDSEKLTLEMVKGQKFTFKQVASTAAWVVPEGEKKRKLSEIVK